MISEGRVLLLKANVFQYIFCCVSFLVLYMCVISEQRIIFSSSFGLMWVYGIIYTTLRSSSFGLMWVRCRWYVRVLAVRGFYDRRCYPDVAMKSRPIHTRSMYSGPPLIQNTLRTGECSIKSVWGLQLLMLLYVKTVRIWYTRSRNCTESRRAKFRPWHILLPNRTFDICDFDITSTYHRYAC